MADHLDLIGEDEEPLSVRELDRALAPYATVAERRRFLRALADARLIVFRAEPVRT